MARELAVVLANGSVQSAVACALAAQKHRLVMIFAETAATAGRPGHAFDALVQHFKPYRSHRLPMPFVGTPAGRGAGGDQSIVKAADARSNDATIVRLVELMPVFAAGLRQALLYDASLLSLGTRVGSESPDDLARLTEFGQLWAEMAQVTCDRPTLEVTMPLLELDPWQVVDLGVQVGAPLHLAWSCENLAGDPCGACGGCRTRDAAFRRAGRPDPSRAPAKTAG